MFRAIYFRGTLPAILLAIGVFHVINADCPPGWKNWRDSCYILLTEKLFWSDASKACGELQSRIFVPNSIEENHFVHVNIQKGIKANGKCGVRPDWIACSLWVGFKNQGDGHQDLFDHMWASTDRESEECAIMSLSSEGKWQHYSCNDQASQFVVCETKHQPYLYTIVAGNDGRFTPQCLRHHAIRSVPAKGVIGCGEACWAEPLCRSFNLWQGSQRGVCQLNNATHFETGRENMISDKECIYFEL